MMLLWQAAVAHAGPLEDCAQEQDIDRRIHGCTDRIRQFPRDASAFFNRGSAYLRKGDPDLAIADNTRVIEIDRAYAAAYYHRGIAYESKAQYDPAIADFGKAVEINPRQAEAFDARARIYLKTGHSSLALRDAESAVSLDRFNEKFLDTRARANEALSRTQEAIADYRRILSHKPSIQSAIDGLKRLGAGASSSVLNESAEAGRLDKGSAKAHQYTAQPRYSQQEIECERAAQADPAGQFAGYPCWARAALSNRRR